MDRASITVTTKNGTNYDANHISIERRFTDNGNISEVSFLCSGTRTTLNQDEIESISFSPSSAQWCSECDNRLDGFK